MYHKKKGRVAYISRGHVCSSLEPGHCDDQKTRSFVFLPKKLFSIHFDPKNLENTPETLLNQLMAT
jgi:hypothetical protein